MSCRTAQSDLSAKARVPAAPLGEIIVPWWGVQVANVGEVKAI
jgi:hypothetical protein